MIADAAWLAKLFGQAGIPLVPIEQISPSVLPKIRTRPKWCFRRAGCDARPSDKFGHKATASRRF